MWEIFDSQVGKVPWRRERLPTPVFWPGEFHGLYSPRTHSQTRLSSFHFLRNLSDISKFVSNIIVLMSQLSILLKH